jgi:murein L,D-transpeptidase YcbB/YkuD
MEIYRSGGRLVVGESDLAAPEVVADLYQLGRFEPIWTNAGLRGHLLTAIRQSTRHGLLPSDYHAESLEAWYVDAEMPEDPSEAADVDLLLTDALIRLAFHLRFGKVDPQALDADWNFERELRNADPAQTLRDIVDTGSLRTELEALAPQRPYYGQLQEALARYREIESRGGWDAVDDGPTLHLEDEGPRVLQLRARLQATGDLIRDPASGAAGLGGRVFDAELEEAVKTYQHRNGLEADGVVGRVTLEAMNIPVEARIDQIRVNLERARWVLQDIGDDYVVADIAGFEVRVIRNDEQVWTTRAQVGQPYRQTPVFRADMAYAVFNPTWTVPPTILREDVLPAIRADRGYLEQKHMEVLDHSGRVVDPSSVDWSRYPGESFPYIIRQRPGPWNALGQVKYIFPNPHFIFMHDTPSRSLFARDLRTFSSGCIRLEDPVGFGVQVLNDPERWNEETVAEAMTRDEPWTVHLQEPMPVLLLYWTAEADPDGHVHFKRDVYDRDPPVLEELNGDFRMWMEANQGR